MQAKIKFLALAGAIATAASLVAGTLVLDIGRPSVNPEAQAKHAVLVVRGSACAHPERTRITANAEGVINGKRETIPLKLMPLSGPGIYGVARQWPAEGRWVLTIVAANPDFKRQPSVIVSVNGDTADFASVKHADRAPTTEEVQAALAAPALSARMR